VTTASRGVRRRVARSPSSGTSATIAATSSTSRPSAHVRLVACASRTLILADHSKLGNTAPFHVTPWSRVHALVVDEPWAEGEAAGVPVVVAR
jgi:DeoR/GlpR family transcriptional regulator of sugar metabolism